MQYMIKQFDDLHLMEHFLNVEIDPSFELIEMCAVDNQAHYSFICVFKRKGK